MKGVLPDRNFVMCMMKSLSDAWIKFVEIDGHR